MTEEIQEQVPTEQVPTVDENFDSLLSQIEAKLEPANNEEPNDNNELEDVVETTSEEDKIEVDPEPEIPKNTCSFTKGDQKWDIDEDAEFTFKADKGEVTRTLKELRDASAGDVAIRNRMREVAEERKSLQKPIKKFISVSKTDPLRALKIIAEQAKQFDEDFTYENFIQSLAKQGRDLSSMSADQKKAYNLSKELEEIKNDSKSKSDEVEERNRKQEFLEKTRLSEDEFEYMGEQILANETLSENIKTQEDLENMIGQLAVETELQKRAFGLWKEVNPEIVDEDIKNPLVHAITKQMRQNPDFTNEDLKDIIKDVVAGDKRNRAVRSLSRKKDRTVRAGRQRTVNNNKTNFQSLMGKIEEKKRNKN
jgi:hypothetical protein